MRKPGSIDNFVCSSNRTHELGGKMAFAQSVVDVPFETTGGDDMHGTLRAVLFDMDGTLTNTEELWTVALHEMAADLGGQLSRLTRVRMVGRPFVEVIEMLHTETGASRAVEATGRELLHKVAELFRRGVPWQPGARELLNAVRRAGLRTALVTSSPSRLVDIAVDTLGRNCFDVTVCGDDVVRGKPDPEPYLQAMRHLGLTAADCIAIEDSPSGALSAERAGLPVLVVPSDAPVPAGAARTIVSSLVGQSPLSLRFAHTTHVANSAYAAGF
jgi:HAD superfamily hydrolase (TIGR01509 family)